MQERETAVVLNQCDVVRERCVAEGFRCSRMVDEGVLEEPERAVRSKRDDVLIVTTKHRAHSLGEESVEAGR